MLVDLAQGAKPRSALGGGSGIVGFRVALRSGFVDLRIEFSALGQDGYRLLRDGQKATVHRDTDGTFTWREGSLYPNLHKLQADGLIDGKWEEKETGRKRRYYHITKAGRAALKEKKQSWTELRRAVELILEKSDGPA